MSREICILHANCQGEALKPLLEAHPDFSRYFEIRPYLNYTRQEIANKDMAQCRLFLHQYLAPKWGELASDQLLALLPDNAQAICLPNYFFKGYWPTWTNKFDGIEFADSLLEELLKRSLPQDAVLSLYLKGGAIFGDPQAIAAASLAKEREKEAHTPIKYVDFLESHWREEQLFITVNHPNNALLIRLANELLRLLGLAPLPQSVIDNYQHPQGNFWLPIHPWVGDTLNLPFAAKERLYPCFAGPLTHAQYISVYLACRQYNIRNLTGVLMGLEKFPEGGKLCK